MSDILWCHCVAWHTGLGDGSDGAPEDALIVYVDLNGKQAFPIDELPQPPSDSDAPPTAPPQLQGGSALAADVASGGAAAAPGDTAGAAAPAASRGPAVLRGAAFVLCELPLWTGRAVGERLARRGDGAVEAAEFAAAGSPAPEPGAVWAADAAPAADAAAEADTVAVPLDDGAAAADDVPEQVLRDRKQWFENIPVTAMPLVAVQPDAQLCLCRLDSQTPLARESDQPAFNAASTSGGDVDPAVFMHAAARDMAHGDGPRPAERTDSVGPAVVSEHSEGGSSMHVPFEGVDVEQLVETEAAGRGEDAQRSGEGEEDALRAPDLLYFFKADVSTGDFAHTSAAEPTPRSWTGGFLQGLSGWLAPGSAASAAPQRKAGWGLSAGSGDRDAVAAERSFKTMLRSKSENIAALGLGAADGGDGDGEPSWRGKGSSRVLEGVWLALGGRAGSRPLEGGEETARDVEGLRGLPSARGSVGRGPASAALVDVV